MVNLILSCLSFAIVNTSAISVDGSGDYASYSRTIICRGGFSLPCYQQMILQNSPNPNVVYGADGYFVGDLQTRVNLNYDSIGGTLNYSFEFIDFEIINLHYYLNLNALGEYVEVPLTFDSFTLDINQDRNQFLLYYKDDAINISNFSLDLTSIGHDSTGYYPVFVLRYFEDGERISIANNVSVSRRVYIDVNDTLTYNDGKNFTLSLPLNNNIHHQIGFESSNYLCFESAMVLNNSQYNYDVGYDDGYGDGYDYGYGIGHADGWNEGFNADSTATTIFNGILSIGMLPINVFLAMFNFEILGINMSSFVTALLSVSMVVIIFRFLFNGKSGD